MYTKALFYILVMFLKSAHKPEKQIKNDNPIKKSHK